MGDDLFPKVAIAPGKFSLNTDLLPNPNVTVCDGRFDIFAESSFDHVVIGPSLNMVPNPAAFVREVTSKLRQGGHVVLYLKKNVEPSPYVRFQFQEPALQDILAQAGAWRVKYQDVRGDDMLLIAKKVSGAKGTIYPMKSKAAKRACIARYGALGDMVLITPLIRRLHEDGYEVTMNVTPYAAPLLDNNPYVANIVIQEREAIPNRDLGAYWDEWKKEYDTYINLSESIEGRLLKVEGRWDYFTDQEYRKKVCGDVNYQDWTMRLGGYPDAGPVRGELFFSPAERKEALAMKKELAGKFVVGWALKGSSHHKMYPLTEPVLTDWLPKHPDAMVFLLGGPESAEFEFDHPQVVKTSGAWSLRKTLAFVALVADAVIGPESLVVNVASCYDIPKITFLSHSNHTNLCRDWKNDYCLTPDTTIAPCYPCHQLHYTLESCPQGQIRAHETGELFAQGPVCTMAAIPGSRVIARLDEVYSAVRSEDRVAVV